MPSTLALAALSSALLACARADLVPTAPGPGETFDAGSACTIEWDADAGGTWTNVTIGARPPLPCASPRLTLRARPDVRLEHEHDARDDRRARARRHRRGALAVRVAVPRRRAVRRDLLLPGARRAHSSLRL